MKKLPRLPSEIIHKILTLCDIDTRRAFGVYNKIAIPDHFKALHASVPPVEYPISPFGDYTVRLGVLGTIDDKHVHLYIIHKLHESYHSITSTHAQTYVLQRTRHTQDFRIGSIFSNMPSGLNQWSNHVFHVRTFEDL
jgi:hypothetical protein